jgi:putative lysine transport system ATP-binding protein
MAYISASIYVPELTRSIDVELLFPTDGLLVDGREEVKGVITLLHGLYGSGKDWLRLSAAGRYAYDRGYILICPSCGNSFYCDMVYGQPYYSAIVKYLSRQMDLIFKIPREREKNYIAGLSMGGYGAMRIGLLNPDRYAAIGAFSGALDMAAMVKNAAESPYRSFFTPVFGEKLEIPEDGDLIKLIAAAAGGVKKYGQRIMITCGLQDEENYHVHSQNQNFLAAARKAGVEPFYREWDGAHVWHVWDRSLAEFIGFIEGSAYGEETKDHWN